MRIRTAGALIEKAWLSVSIQAYRHMWMIREVCASAVLQLGILGIAKATRPLCMAFFNAANTDL